MDINEIITFDDYKKYLNEIQARIDATTKGPWSDGGIGRHDDHIVFHSDDVLKVIANCKTDADAEFIAHAKEDVPVLISLAAAANESENLFRNRYTIAETELIKLRKENGALRQLLNKDL